MRFAVRNLEGLLFHSSSLWTRWACLLYNSRRQETNSWRLQMQISGQERSGLWPSQRRLQMQISGQERSGLWPSQRRLQMQTSGQERSRLWPSQRRLQMQTSGQESSRLW
jgi:hypothetical protein